MIRVGLFTTLLFLFLGACSYLPEEVNIAEGINRQETADYIYLYKENASQASTGIAFYPGGLVDAHAYIPLLQRLAQDNYPVLIAKVNANLAITNIGKMKRLIADFPQIERWVIGGHSLGGSVAAFDVEADPTRYVGLYLLASFSNEQGDLSNWSGAVLSLYGELDGLATPADIDAAKPFLPPASIVTQLIDMPITPTGGQTIYHEIQGGNHAQFGNYGPQDSDNEATISREAQQTEVANYIRSFLIANQW